MPALLSELTLHCRQYGSSQLRPTTRHCTGERHPAREQQRDGTSSSLMLRSSSPPHASLCRLPRSYNQQRRRSARRMSCVVHGGAARSCCDEFELNARANRRRPPFHHQPYPPHRSLPLAPTSIPSLLPRCRSTPLPPTCCMTPPPTPSSSLSQALSPRPSLHRSSPNPDRLQTPALLPSSLPTRPSPPPLSTSKPRPPPSSSHSGWLLKIGGKIQTWHRRFFFIRHSALCYAKKERGDVLQAIPLVGQCPAPLPAHQRAQQPGAPVGPDA